MKFKTRPSTDFLYLCFQDTGSLSVPELRRVARKAGKLDIDYHYVLQENGVVEQGREPYVVAGYELENCDRSIYVLIDCGTNGKLTDSQKVSLKDLQDSIIATYPDICVVVENK